MNYMFDFGTTPRMQALQYVAKKNSENLKQAFSIVSDLIDLAASQGRYFATFDWLPAEIVRQLESDQFRVKEKHWYESGPKFTVRWDHREF